MSKIGRYELCDRLTKAEATLERIRAKFASCAAYCEPYCLQCAREIERELGVSKRSEHDP